jgi:hypothetical protein
MSAGHHHSTAFGMSSQALERIQQDPALRGQLHRYRSLDREHDLPYLAGYSRDGSTIYIDRHLPEELEYELDGRKRPFRPDRFLEIHEGWEKTLIDRLGYTYDGAHRVATGAERRAVLAAGLDWSAYSNALKPYIKADEHEHLEKVPADLDMTPYLSPPVDHALVERMQAAMGGERKHSKAEASYASNKGIGSRHCGPRRGWPTGDCEHFEAPRTCDLVRGVIAPEGLCKYWSAK